MMETTTTKKMRLARYPEYKDSGEFWLGATPSHWEIKKLKHLFYEKRKVSNPELSCGSISFGKVVYKDDEKIPESTKASYQEVLAGEFLINPLNLNYDLISLRIGLSEINVVVSSGYIVIKNSGDIDKSYYKWLLHRYDVAFMKLLGSGVRQTISFTHIANSLLPYPPLPEQKAIAAFLDEKTAKIDQAIQQKERLIALLKERKQIIIQQAVTKGLDPHAKMKDSGVDWIGEIPEGWGMPERMKFISTMRGRLGWQGLKASEYTDEGPIIISSAHFNNNRIAWDTCPHVSLERYNLDSNIQLKVGDLLLMKDGAKMGKLAFVDYLPGLACLNSHLLLFRPISKGKDLSYVPKYLFYLFQTDLFQDYVQINGTGSTFPGISQESVGNYFVCLPTQEEQHAIVHHIETQSTKIDAAIALQEKQIEKLKEYKATLIDSVVTGKVKVTGV